MDNNEYSFDELDTTIVLHDEEGNEVTFEFLDLIEYEDESYVILLPVDDEDGDVVILKLEATDDPEEEAYVPVEDEAALNAVFEIFRENFKDEFNFTDEE